MDDIKRATPKPAFRSPLSAPQNAPASFTTPVAPVTRARRSPLRLMLLYSALSLLLLSVAFLVVSKGIHLSQNMQFENTARQSFVSELQKLAHGFFAAQPDTLRGEDRGRINILLLGRAGEHYPGKNLTDTVMIMSVDTVMKKVALLSLPRDLYVPIADTEFSTKLNSLYQYGLSRGEGVAPLRQTIESITGEPIDYFITLDFDGFEKIVDALGGISLEVPRDFYDTRYPGKNYSYETFEIKKGWQTLDGATALKYVRERHNDPEGDFGRAKRQQQVLQALKNKAFSLGTLWNIALQNRLLDTLGESVKTDMTLEDMARFLTLSRTLDTKNITTVVIDAWKKESLLRVSHIQVGDIAAFILVPRVGNWSELQDTSATLFRREEQQKRKQVILDEQVSLTLFAVEADSLPASRLAALLKDELGFATVTTLLLPAVDNRAKESIIVGRVGLSKPFSLDELLRRFSLTPVAALPFTSRERTQSDYAIVMGQDLAEIFSLTEADEALTALDDASFSEPLPPQPKR